MMSTSNLQSKRTSAEPGPVDSKAANSEAKEAVIVTNPEQPAAETVEPVKADAAKVVELADEAARLSLDEKAKEIEPADATPNTAETNDKVNKEEIVETVPPSLKRPLEDITPAENKEAAEAESVQNQSKRLRVEETKVDATAEKKPDADEKAEEPVQIDTCPEKAIAKPAEKQASDTVSEPAAGKVSGE